MSRKIVELYIDSVKGISQGRNPYVASKNPYSMRRRLGSLEGNVKITTRTFAGWSEKDTRIIELLKSTSGRYGFELKIYDVARTSHILRAYVRGVRKIPSVIIGKKKLSGQITEKAIIKALARKNKR